MSQCRWGTGIRVNIHTHIDRCDKGDAPWLVLVNGLFADHTSWNEGVKLLAPHFNILRYDTRGQGESDSPHGIYDLAAHTSDLEQVIASHKLDKFFLLGLSNGARTALEFSRRHPASVIGLVACDTFDRVGPLLRLKIESWLKANTIGGPYHRFDVAMPWIWGETILARHPEIVEYYRNRANLMELRVVESLIRGTLMGEIEVSEIETPTLFLVGDEDLLTPKSYHEAMASQMKNASVIEVSGGHASVLEYPSTLETDVLPFFKKLMSREFSHVG